MLKCPVCKASYKQEVNICKQCCLSEQDIDLINEINRENPIFKTCIPTLLKIINERNKQIKSFRNNEVLSKLNYLESKIQISTLERNRDRQQIEELEKKFIILESRLNNKERDKHLNSVSKDRDEDGNYEPLISVADTQDHFNNQAGDKLQSPNYRNDFNTSENLEINANNIEEEANNVFPQESDHLNNNRDRENYISNEPNKIERHKLQFVNDYNFDKQSFESKVISIVTETQESMENRLAGRSENVYLSDNTKGKYWIMEEDDNYYLVPGAKIRINEHNKHTIENLFEFDESDSGYDNFQLIQAAKVLRTNSELWQLENKGELEFS